MKKGLFLIIAITMLQPMSAQVLKTHEIDRMTDDYLSDGIEKLRTFLTLSNIGSNPNDIDENLNWCRQTFESLGFTTETLLSNEVKHLLAQRQINAALPTLLVYLQIDGQPVDPKKWEQENPFIPILKENQNGKFKTIPWSALNEEINPDWRIFARSSSDSKGPAVAFIHALSLLQSSKIDLSYNLKIIMDFQEELGSPTLSKLVESNRAKFEADALLIMDGTRPPSNIPTLTFGARGIATLKLTVYGANTDLHSGQYGNYAPNPVFRLSKLLGAMKDDDGKVLIPGYYDGVLMTEQKRTLIRTSLDQEQQLNNRLGIAKAETVGATYQESLQFPSLNVRGLKAAWTGGQVRTIIPSTAVAEMDLRLVPNTPAERQISLIKSFIESKGFYIVEKDPTQEERLQHAKLIKVESRIGSRAFQTALDSKLALWLEKVMTEVFGANNFFRMQTTGGSQPIAPFITELNLPALSVRIPNPDNNIHAPNENLRLGNFKEGIKMCLGILSHPYE